MITAIGCKTVEAASLAAEIFAEGICDIRKGNTKKGWQSVRFSLGMFGVLLVVLLSAIYYLLRAL